ncbi:hypothetical protein FSS13T_11810 [Flavobacterium saliperosum S13]|uniref:phosphoribosylglycinamide formyltransferase 1 n=1 Tax=Flavobacterium saliperosum S13 TaxID=1341155 RepID=A0ABP3A0C5_9FLAO|nr:hypothetical protein FSS13T_11810 [Flavobacterium saliperosum S13]
MRINAEVVGVIADRECSALEFATSKSIYFKKIKYNRNYTLELQSELKKLVPDVIVTNIHKIIDIDTLSLFPNKFVNLHYSLLPAFSGVIGMETIAQAKVKNVGFVGGTCHLVNEEVDAGKVLCQSCVPINWKKDQLVIDTVFKSSSLALLGGIFTILNIKTDRNEQLIINKERVLFSPPLPFNTSFLSKEFWEKVAK